VRVTWTEIEETCRGPQPQRREMPEQRARKPAPERDCARKPEREQRRRVVDFPTGADHDNHGNEIDPVGDAHPYRMYDRTRRGGRRQDLIVGGLDRHNAALVAVFVTWFLAQLLQAIAGDL